VGLDGLADAGFGSQLVFASAWRELGSPFRRCWLSDTSLFMRFAHEGFTYITFHRADA
jgi:hypothetical protein